MNQFFGRLALLVGLVWALPLSAEPPPLYFTAPFIDEPLMATDDGNDLFAACPTYRIRDASQVIVDDHLVLQPAEEGAEEDPGRGADFSRDFGVAVRAAWSPEALFLRLDINDDRIVISRGEAGEPRGDYLQVVLRRLTAGPDRTSQRPISIFLLPNPDDDACRVMVEGGSESERRKFGEPEAKLFRQLGTGRTTGQYSIILRLPVSGWDEAPTQKSYSRLQLLATDVDIVTEEGVTRTERSRFAMIPAGNEPVTAASGVLCFVSDTWCEPWPLDVIYGGSVARINLNYGNLGDRPVRLEFRLIDSQTEKPIDDYFESVEVGTGKYAQDAIFKLNLGDVPRGRYRFHASIVAEIGELRSTRYIYPGRILVDRFKDLVVFPGLISIWSPEERDRDLVAYDSEEAQDQAIEALAGGGEVLWRAGVFDASHNEFGGGLRVRQAAEVTVPQATAKDIHWALYGGRNHLDGVNEPLVLKFAPELFTTGHDLAPDLPAFDEYRFNLPARQMAARATRLLLVGLVYDYQRDSEPPEIEIRSNAGFGVGSGPIVKQVLQPGPDSRQGERHAYVLRAWLLPGQTTVEIENVSPFGAQVSLDFIALLGEPEEPDSVDGPTIRFDGRSEARLFTRQLAASRYLLTEYLVDRNGHLYNSLPGGRNPVVDPTHTGLVVRELAAWGHLDKAARVIRRYPTVRRRYGVVPNDRLLLSDVAMVSGVETYWRLSDREIDWLRSNWLGYVHNPMVRLARAIGSNSQRLPSVYGEFGLPDLNRLGSTTAACFATQGALRSAQEMAQSYGGSQNQMQWRNLARDLERNFYRQLAAPPRGLAFAHGEGLGRIPSGSLLYGRYRNGEIVAQLDGRDVYNSPRLFEGLPYQIVAQGFRADEQLVERLTDTLDYVNERSPAARQTAFGTHRLLEGEPTTAQIGYCLANLLAGRYDRASDAVNGLVRFTHDEFVAWQYDPERRPAYAEYSPYLPEEFLHVNMRSVARGARKRIVGYNAGGGGDEGGLLLSTMTMQLGRVLAGIDDSNPRELYLMPMLPNGWTWVEARNVRVSHSELLQNLATINFSYGPTDRDVYGINLQSSSRLAKVSLRVGPFTPGTRQVLVLSGADRRSVPTEVVEDHAWAWIELRNVQQEKMVVRGQ